MHVWLTADTGGPSLVCRRLDRAIMMVTVKATNKIMIIKMRMEIAVVVGTMTPVTSSTTMEKDRSNLNSLINCFDLCLPAGDKFVVVATIVIVVVVDTISSFVMVVVADIVSVMVETHTDGSAVADLMYSSDEVTSPSSAVTVVAIVFEGDNDTEVDRGTGQTMRGGALSSGPAVLLQVITAFWVKLPEKMTVEFLLISALSQLSGISIQDMFPDSFLQMTSKFSFEY